MEWALPLWVVPKQWLVDAQLASSEQLLHPSLKGSSLAALAVEVHSFELAAEERVFAIAVEEQASEFAVAEVCSALLLATGTA